MRGRFSRSILALGGFALLGAVGIASAEKPVAAEVGNLPFAFSSDFFPKKLPKKVLAPIVLRVSHKLRTTGGIQPSPLREFTLELDRNVDVDLNGYPICRGGGTHVRYPEKIARTCKGSIVGEGELATSVAFPEQPAIPAASKLLLLNGGHLGGKTTLYAYAYLTQPITAAIVVPVKLSRRGSGRLRTVAIFDFPPIANGAGSVTGFDLTINKDLEVNGEPFSVLNGRCPDGHLDARASALFADGGGSEAEAARPCVSR